MEPWEWVVEVVRWGSITITVACAVASVWNVRRAWRRAYAMGWVRGRIALLEHLRESLENDVPYDQFIRQVVARDGFLLPGDMPPT